MRRCDRLSALDTAPLHYVSEAGYNHGASLSIIEGDVSYDAYVQDLEARVPFLPRLRQIAVPVPFNLAYPTWEFDPSFHLRNHVSHVPLDPPGRWDQLVDVVSGLYSVRLPTDRPHWSMHLIAGLERNRTALFFKIHHAVSDGIGAEELRRVLYGPKPPDKSVLPVEPVPPLPGAGKRLWWGLRDNVRTGAGIVARAPRDIVRFARWACSADARQTIRLQRAYTRAPGLRFPFNSLCRGRVTLAFTQFRLEELRAIGKLCEATINDVLIAMIGQAVQYYAHAHGIATNGKMLKVHMPVNMRRDDQPRNMGNVATILPVPVPLDGAAPLERVRAVSEFTRALKQCHAASATYELIKRILFCLTPVFAPVVQRHAASLKAQRGGARNGRPPKVNMVVSNVPRRPVPLYVAGHPILIRYAIGSPIPHIGITCVAFTCGLHLSISFAANADGAPDLDCLRAFLEQAFEDLRIDAGLGDSYSR